MTHALFCNFTKELNRVGSPFGWDEAKLSQILPCLLTADALAVYDVLPDAVKTNWRQLIKEMGKRLNNQNDLTSALAKLLQRSQRAGESISEYALAVRDLVRLAYTDNGGFDDTARSKWEILHFRRGLTPRIKLEVGRLPVPDTLDAAISEAIAESDRQKDFQSDLMRNDQLVATAQMQVDHQKLRNEVDLLNDQFSDFSVSVAQKPSAFSEHPRTFQDCDTPDDSYLFGCEDRQLEPPARSQAQQPPHRPSSTSRDQPPFSQEDEEQEDGRYQANALFRSGSALDLYMPYLAVFTVLFAFIGAAGAMDQLVNRPPAAYVHTRSPSQHDNSSRHATYGYPSTVFVNNLQHPPSPTSHHHLQQASSEYSSSDLFNGEIPSTQSSSAPTPLSSRVITSIYQPQLTATDRLILVIAFTSAFIVLVVAAHAFRQHYQLDNHLHTYLLVSQPPDAIDILRTSSADSNDNQQPTAPPLCSIAYSATTSRHRFVNVQLHDHDVPALVDTGAEASIVRPSLIQHLQLPLDANPTSSNGTTASGGILFFYGTVTTTLSVARHSIHLRLLVATTDAIPAPCIIGLDVLSSLLQPVSFDFTNNFLNIANIPVQLYEMPSTRSAKKFVPSSFGRLLRVPSLIDANYVSTPQYINSPSTSTDPTTATTMQISCTIPSTAADEIAAHQPPATVNATFDMTNRPLFVFNAIINGTQTQATFDSTVPRRRHADAASASATSLAYRSQNGIVRQPRPADTSLNSSAAP